MGDRSAIEWTDSTWNAVTGCTEVSPGCDHCYARTLAHGKLAKVYGARLPVVDSEANRADTFAVRLWPERLDQPLRWKRPRRIFVNSMSDFFHAEIPEAFQLSQLETMLMADWHTYQVLTKRPGRAIRFLERNEVMFGPCPLPSHIWLGATVEHQETAFRVDQLRQCHASVRFLSCEPLLGPLDLDLTGIHWLIAGGESGPGFRPMNPDWVRSLRDQCLAAGVAFHFKQWGGRTPKAGGRELDGRTWDEFPNRPSPDSESSSPERED